MAAKRPRGGKKPARAAAAAGPPREFPVVGFGASAGGLEAFTSVLNRLPANLGMAYVLVQHLDPTHESLLTDLLRRSTKMPVHEVKDGMPVLPDQVYVIPPNATIVINQMALRVTSHQGERLHKHMTVDSFFRSLAEERKEHAIGVILSGTGSDGVIGLEAIKAEGGIALCQEESTAKYFGMPHSAIEAGCVDLVLSPTEIARELEAISHHLRSGAGPAQEVIAAAPTNLQRIFALLRKASGVDFSGYKINTVMRRIMRRVSLQKLPGIQEYVRFLSKNPAEVDALYQDLLIKVTHFFREPALFQALKTRILPALTKGRPHEAPIRIWVPGCSTGEEAYSIGIALTEYLRQSGRAATFQIFATDLSEQAIERARQGVYPESIVADVSPDRLKRYFQKVERGYIISKAIRDACVLARHDLTRDPPFSKLDIISCRNVLIYLDASVHRRIIPNFHYALKPGGYLLLGSSEAIGGFSNLFSMLDRGLKVYVKKSTLAPAAFELPRLAGGARSPRLRPRRPRRGSAASWTSRRRWTASSWGATPPRGSSWTRRWRSSPSAGRRTSTSRTPPAARA